jgi:hypothetical protein
MSFDPGSLFASLFISTVGFALLGYGKKQSRFPQMAVGLVMLIYPYFVSSALWMVGIAALLLAALGAALKLGL